MKTIWNVFLGVVGVFFTIFFPIIGIPLLILIVLKIIFKILKYTVLIAVFFFILCLIIGVFVA
jgi:hypothetical protein